MKGGIGLNISFVVSQMDSNTITEIKLMQLLNEAYQQGYEDGKTDGKIAMLDIIGRMTTKANEMEEV